MPKKILEFPSPKIKERPPTKANCTEVIKYDDEGKAIKDIVYRPKSQNGSGFVISYTEKMIEFVKKYDSPNVVRMFMYFAHNQQYGDNGVYGFQCARKHLEDALNITRKTVYNTLQILRSDFLVLETKVNGLSEFMVNPNYITIGKNKDARIREWNRRWEEFFKSGGKI